MSDFEACVKGELLRARATFAPINSYHEGYAVLLEELDEFWEQVRRWPKRHDPEQMRKELVQLAAMAQRTAEDMERKEARRE